MTNEELKAMSDGELKQKIAELNEYLKKLGCECGIGKIIYGCRRYGKHYENKPLKNNNGRPTPMNCFAVIAHMYPALSINLIKERAFEEFLKKISELGMCLEEHLETRMDGKETELIPEEWK